MDYREGENQKSQSLSVRERFQTTNNFNYVDFKKIEISKNANEETRSFSKQRDLSKIHNKNQLILTFSMDLF